MGKYALLIGVDTYGEGLQPLPAASKDVAALREVLLNPKMGGFDEAKPVINPMQPEMSREIELWFQDRQPEDLVLLFFSGHGVKDDRRDLYFAAANTEKQRDRLLTSTATSARFLHDRIRGCKAKYQVLILDCCFSGAFGDFVARDDGEIPLEEQLGAEGRVVLTSTSAVDYSFEEKGADLSIYTRYLVEGIATGAADEDGDGAITAEELHRYAGRKVEEASPAMSPKIFIPQGTGYRIRLARSPQDDPRLKYRKEAERRATAAEFTIPAKRLLMGLRAELGLSEAEAEAIEAEVLKPYREYQRKRQEYQETLHQCLECEFPLSQRTIDDLKDYRAHLRLKPEDVAAIEQAALNGHDLDGYVAELECQRQQEANKSHDDSEEVNFDKEIHHDLKQPQVSRKELSECDPSKILFIKNVRAPHGGWAYLLDHIQRIGGSAESRVFELFWLSSSKGAKAASKGDLMLLNQQAKITHIVEMLDDDVRENAAGYFRWVRVVWMPEEANWSKLPHQRDIIGFEPPTIGGGTAYLLANLGKLKETWNSLEAFQQHVFQVLTELISFNTEVSDADDLASEKGIDYACLRDLLKAQDWRAADQETYEVMLSVVGKKTDDFFDSDDLLNFPCTDLRTIDCLWVKYSQGKFGFSVQKQIYVECGAKLDGEYPGHEICGEFFDRVGWRKGGKHLYCEDLKADPSLSPAGEFPWWGYYEGGWRYVEECLLSRTETCKL
jgi:uncharacterized caspase-like protein